MLDVCHHFEMLTCGNIYPRCWVGQRVSKTVY